jgi:hypothetical protein
MLKLLFCFFFRLYASTADFEAINNMGLTTYQKERVWIFDTDAEFLLFIFIDPNCPITQNYIPKINVLTSEYDLSVYGVQPNLGTAYDEVMKFKDDYDFKFPVINDSFQKLTFYLNASVTPEVFLLDKSGTVIYSGAIDNWFFDLGRYRKSATIHYLRDALDSNYESLFSVNDNTKAIGCLIQRK